MKGLHCFPKAEKMVSRKSIEELFTRGSKAFTIFPLRIIFKLQEASKDPPVSLLISVSKKRLHHAVDRNKAKRQIREAFRLNKDILSIPATEQGKSLCVACIWLSETPQPSAKIHLCLKKLLHSIAEHI